MYKNIVPGMISFETTLRDLRGCYYSDNFDYYPAVREKNRFHYGVFVNDNIKIPQKYDFKDAFFIKSGSKWYYHRNLGPIHLKFCFDPSKRTFSFNSIYRTLPFRIGDIVPVGLLISDFINMNLFLDGVTTFKGCAYNFKNKNICILAPSNNGKTKLIEKILERNGKYISEDILLLDLQKEIVYPNCIRSDFFAIIRGKRLRNLRREELIMEPQSISNIFVVQNFTSKNYISPNKSIYDFFHIWRVSFNVNPLLRSYVFEELLRSKIDYRLNMLKQKKAGWIFKQIRNFNYEFLGI